MKHELIFILKFSGIPLNCSHSLYFELKGRVTRSRHRRYPALFKCFWKFTFFCKTTSISFSEIDSRIAIFSIPSKCLNCVNLSKFEFLTNMLMRLYQWLKVLSEIGFQYNYIVINSSYFIFKLEVKNQSINVGILCQITWTQR